MFSSTWHGGFNFLFAYYLSNLHNTEHLFNVAHLFANVFEGRYDAMIDAIPHFSADSMNCLVNIAFVPSPKNSRTLVRVCVKSIITHACKFSSMYRFSVYTTTDTIKYDLCHNSRSMLIVFMKQSFHLSIYVLPIIALKALNKTHSYFCHIRDQIITIKNFKK